MVRAGMVAIVAALLTMGCADRRGGRPAEGGGRDGAAAADGAIGPRDGGGDGGIGGEGDAASAVDGGSSTGGDGGREGEDAGPAAIRIDVCMPACSTVSDCTSPGTLYDADNYECAAGACRYTGCNTDAECAEIAPSYVCHAFRGGFRSCTPRCSSASDCTGTTSLYDADNYACVSSACEWVGCNTDAECIEAISDSRYACREVSGYRGCFMRCEAASDCGIDNPAYDADNWTCEAGVCRWTGCNSDAECGSVGTGYVCRPS